MRNSLTVSVIYYRNRQRIRQELRRFTKKVDLSPFMGTTATDRQCAYRALSDEVLSADDISDIRAYIQQQRALGNDRFRAIVPQKLGRCASIRPAHRPRASPRSTDKAL